MNNESIETLQGAKEFFKSMGCFHFHMSRDDPQRYEYRDLNILEQIETEWRTERFNAYYNSIMDGINDTELWNTHSVMYELLESLKTEDTLAKTLEVTQNIRDKIPARDRIIVVEKLMAEQGEELEVG